MSFMLRSHHDRYRQKAREHVYRNMTIAACLLFAIITGYFIGQKRQEQDARQLQQHAQELEAGTKKAEQLTGQLQADHQTLQIQYKQLQDRYQKDVPQGDLALLSNLVKEQLDKGMATDRLVQIIRSAQPPTNCSQAISKRFILSTLAYKGPQSAVTFADGAITVKGNGEPSINSKQEKEAWFDPGKPVEIDFSAIDGKKEAKTGLLPLHHTMIVQNKEYRFTISEGPRSFIVVTSDNCDYTGNP